MPSTGTSPSSPARRTQQQRSEATTGELLDAARELFSADGYQATSLDGITRRAGMTKGALYHHFADKEDLFRAVFEREQRVIADVVERAYRRKRDPWDGFLAGCRAFLEITLDPRVQRLTLLDAPAVLGWEQMRGIEARYGLAQLKSTLKLLIAEGRIAARPVDPLAHMLHGAICEGALVIARADDQRAAMRHVTRELRALLAGLAAG